MKLTGFITVVLLIFVNHAVTQSWPGTLSPYYKIVTTPYFTPPEYTDYVDGIAKMQFSKENREIIGTPFLNDDFLFGVLVFHDGTRIEGQRYRYNIYADEMQFIFKEDTVSIYQPLKVKSIEMGKQKFIHDLWISGPDQMEAGYFEVLAEGEASLLLRRIVRLEVDEYVPNYMGGGGSKDLYYKHSKFYYIKYLDEAARKVRNKKDLLNILSNHKSEINGYVKENHLKIRKEKDLIDIIAFYNKL